MSVVNPPGNMVSLSKHVQEMAIDGHEPPPRYIVKDTIFGPTRPPPLAPIPVIDLSLVASLSSQEQHGELQRLKSALSSWGCFQLIGHGISGSFLDDVRGVSKQFFALPMEEKRRYSRAAEDLDGYGNDPVLSDKQVLDWSDRLFLTLTPEDSRKLNLWPQRPRNFREILNEYSTTIKRITDLLLKAMARSLNLEDDCFMNQFGQKEYMAARFNLYPKCPRPDLVLGAKAHSDGSGITLLLQDKQVEGLQILKDDQWFRVPTIPHALLVNAGDQMQIISNGVFKSPLHRVSANADRERISLAVFYLPDPETEIEPVRGLIDDKRPQQYRRLNNYAAINFECFQSGKIALETVKI